MDNEMKMDQEPKNITEPMKMTNKKNWISRPVLYILLTLLLMFGTGVGAYFLRDSTANKFEKTQADSIAIYQQTITNLEARLTDERINGTPSGIECIPVAPVSTVLENIKASITSGNTAALEGYMASSVNVILAATEAYGAQTPSQAIADVSSFISEDINSWDFDFDLPAITLNSYNQGLYGEYFPSTALVGKASNDKVVSFSFDCDGKIDTIFMANSDSIL